MSRQGPAQSPRSHPKPPWVSVRRGNGSYSTYQLPDGAEEWTVLDALIWVRASVDPTLFFEYSCKYNNACKMCQVRIDGQPGYLCTAIVQDGATVDPIKESRQWRDVAISWAEVW